MAVAQTERSYFIRKLGGTQANTRSLNEIKREYYAKYLGAGSATTPFSQLEKQWILKILATAGITPSRGHFASDLWKQMVASISLPPSSRINKNKSTFFINAS